MLHRQQWSWQVWQNEQTPLVESQIADVGKDPEEVLFAVTSDDGGFAGSAFAARALVPVSVRPHLVVEPMPRCSASRAWVGVADGGTADDPAPFGPASCDAVDVPAGGASPDGSECTSPECLPLLDATPGATPVAVVLSDSTSLGTS